MGLGVAAQSTGLSSECLPLSVSVSACLSVCLSASLCQCVCMPVCLPVCLSLSVCLHACLTASLPVCLSLSEGSSCGRSVQEFVHECYAVAEMIEYGWSD